MAGKRARSPDLETPDSMRGRRKSKHAPNFASPQPVVTIYIKSANQEAEDEYGDGPDKFIVHKNLICRKSLFFDAAFNGQFVEGDTQTMTLDDVRSPVFGMLVNWLYTEKIEDHNQELPDVISLAELWTLGQKCLIPRLQNATMDAILRIFHEIDRRERLLFIKHAYGTTEEYDNPLKLVVCRWFACQQKQTVVSWIGGPENSGIYLPNRLLRDIIYEMKNGNDDAIIPRRLWKNRGDVKVGFHVEEKE